MSGIEAARSAKRRQAAYNIAQVLHRREQAKAYRRTSTLYPTAAYAQDAEMSLHEFEEFVFDVCFLNDVDPIARWKEVSVQQQRLVDWLAGHKRVHILGEGTDLRLSIEGRVFINSDGKRNFPSGEFFTGPVEESANGVIHFDVPASNEGHAIERVRLNFHHRQLVQPTPLTAQTFLYQLLYLTS